MAKNNEKWEKTQNAKTEKNNKKTHFLWKLENSENAGFSATFTIFDEF